MSIHSPLQLCLFLRAAVQSVMDGVAPYKPVSSSFAWSFGNAELHGGTSFDRAAGSLERLGACLKLPGQWPPDSLVIARGLRAGKVRRPDAVLPMGPGTVFSSVGRRCPRASAGRGEQPPPGMPLAKAHCPQNPEKRGGSGPPETPSMQEHCQ